ncbi:unnamed protein product [Aureobasidium pullulans]|nr:unnamed protein product [Aureobasidium pullulans]
MFTTSITIVESDLHIKAPVKNNGNNGGTPNKTKAMISASPVAKGTTNHDEVTNDTKVAGHSRPFAPPTFWFLSSPSPGASLSPPSLNLFPSLPLLSLLTVLLAPSLSLFLALPPLTLTLLPPPSSGDSSGSRC